MKVRGVGFHEVYYVFYLLPAFLSKLFLEGILKQAEINERIAQA